MFDHTEECVSVGAEGSINAPLPVLEVGLVGVGVFGHLSAGHVCIVQVRHLVDVGRGVWILGGATTDKGR